MAKDKKNTKKSVKEKNVNNEVDKKVKQEKLVKEMEDYIKEPIAKIIKPKSSVCLGLCALLLLSSSLGYFTFSLLNFYSLGDIVNGLLMVGISIFIIVSCYTNPSKKMGSRYLTIILLFIYQALGVLVNLGVIVWPSNVVDNFVGKSLTEVVKWSTVNKIDLKQEYEYSDIIPEYHVINQDVLPGKKISDVKRLLVVISEGPSPYKDIVLPNMIGWDTERVLEFIKNNYLTNVSVEFVQGTESENTLINQNVSGNIKRNAEIKLTFSYGEERHYSEIKLSDLTNKSKFEAEFYLKQYGISYEFDYDFSDKIKRGNVIGQSVKAGEIVSVSNDNPTHIKVTISKGAKITVPDLTSMSVTDITNWVIDNKLRIEFKERYDDTAKANTVLEANYKKDDVIEEGTTISITISKGNLVMEKFNSYSEFREWADTYGINYEEQHEFNDTVKAGEVIRYSYDTGATIKNNDVIIVTISDGRKVSVPNVKGLTKDAASSKLSSASLNYSFVYKYTNDSEKGKVINQSISAGSEVSEGTTVTLTISNGARPNNSGSNTSPSKPTTPTTPSTPTCTPKTYTISRELNNIFSNPDSYASVESQLYSFFASRYPEVKIVVVGVSDTGMSAGSYIGGIGPGSSITSCNSSAYTIQIAK